MSEAAPARSERKVVKGLPVSRPVLTEDGEGVGAEAAQHPSQVELHLGDEELKPRRERRDGGALQVVELF